MKLHLHQRLSHKYRDGWRDLDNDQFIGTVKMLRPRLVRDGFDGYIQVARVVAPSKLGSTNLTRAINDTLTDSRCRHDHDCCGCPSTRATAKRVSRRAYSVELHTTFNI